MSEHGHARAYATCAFCPKVCRFACPVSEATKSESLSTWGKMTEAFLVTEGKRPLDRDGASALHACTGCMRCRTFCRHENEVGYALFAGRGAALEQKLAPEPVKSTLETFHSHHNPFGRDLGELVARFRPDSPARYALFPGCTALLKGPGVVEDALFVAARLAAPMAVCKLATRCCGYPLYAAGEGMAFAAHARRFAQALEGYPELVVLDPGCAYTLLVVYPRFGVEPPGRVRTIYDVLASHLGHAPAAPKLEGAVAYHDACHLGRGLGQYEQPRALLAAAAAFVLEAPDHEEEAGCAGGGGLLPRTMPQVAADVARGQARELAPQGQTIVTACPTSRRMFERAGKPAEDLVTLLRRWCEKGG